MSRTTIILLAVLGFLLLAGAGFAIVQSYAKTPTPQVALVSEDARVKAIQEYLSYSEFVKPNFGGRVFTSVHKLGENSSPQEYVMYIWAVSQEYYQKGDVLTEGSGASSPIVVHMTPEGGRVTRIDVPGNGKQYWEDVQRWFPQDIIKDDIFSSNSESYTQKMKALTEGTRSQAIAHFASQTPTSSENKNIVIDSLSSGSLVSSPLKITGKARGWYFEGSFPVEIRDANGKVIAIEPAQAKGDWMTAEYVPFEVTLTFNPTTPEGTIVFKKDNPSGDAVRDESFTLPVRFDNATAEKMNISLYYPNFNKAQEVGDECSPVTVMAVSKTITKSIAPLSDAIRLLVETPLSTADKNEGFTSEFPKDGFRLKGATIKNGVATLEFTEVPGFTSGGACRVTILRSQIEKTALQFPQVTSVKIIPETLFQP